MASYRNEKGCLNGIEDDSTKLGMYMYYKLTVVNWWGRCGKNVKVFK